MNDDFDKLFARLKGRLRRSFGGSSADAAAALVASPVEAEFEAFHQQIISSELTQIPDYCTDGEQIFLQEGDPKPHYTETLIISDIHLGSPVSRARDLRRVLRSWTFDRLIILGDLFDNFRLHRLTREHRRLLADLHYLCTRKNGPEVLWIVGNHDLEAANLMHKLIPARMIPEEEHFIFDCGGTKYLAMHGHQFDEYLNANPIKSHVASAVYLLIQKADFMERKRFSRWVKRRSKELLKVSEELTRKARNYAHEHGADTIICGHTHLALRCEAHGACYINSGCWTETPATLVAVDAEHGARLVEYY